MADDSRAWALGDLVRIERGSTYKSLLLGEEGLVLLGLATIAPNGGFRSDSLRRYAGSSPERMIVQPGEIYASLKDVTQSGDLLGAVARFPHDLGRGRLTQDTVRLVPRSEQGLLTYVYWVLRTPQYRHYCRAHSTGTTTLGLPREDFLAFKIPVLGSYRQELVKVLDATEEKIALNRRMSETLEQMADALFRRWFLDGEAPPTDAGEHGPAVDWAVRPLDRIADFLNGAACQKYPARDGEPSLPVIKIRELNQGITNQSDRVSQQIPAKWHVRNGDVLFSWSGTLLASVWTGGPAALNQHLFKVTSAEYPRWFYLRWVLHHLGDFRGVAADKATTMGHIKRHHLSDAMCRVPPASTLEAMTTVMAPLLDRQIACENESSTLAAIRDALLPKLISGELRIPDAERLVSEVT